MGDLSNPITWIFLHENQLTNKTAPYTIAISFLVSALIICIAIFISVIIISKRNEIKTAIKQRINLEKIAKHTDLTYYECVAESSYNDISTRDNVAYGHAQSSVAGPVN